VDSRRKVFWIVIGGAVCALGVAFATVVLWHDGSSEFTTLSPIASASPNKNDQPGKNEATPATQNLAITPEESTPEVSLPSVPQGPLPVPDETTHKKIVAALNARMREEARKLFAAAFQELGLSANVQDKIVDILTQQEKQLQQQAFEAAKSGTIPTPPSLEEMRAQQTQQDQQLRALLGDAGFAQFNQYRTTIPDRMIMNSMNEEGANLSESQSQQLLQVLTQAREQIIGQSGVTSNLNSMSPNQAIATMQQQQLLLQQTVNSRIQNILTAEQTAILQHALSQRAVGPKSQ